MTNSRRRTQLRRIPCPGCGEVGLRKILYGMPSDEFDFDKYIVGGCVMADFDIGCKKCGWTGIRKELEVQ